MHRLFSCSSFTWSPSYIYQVRAFELCSKDIVHNLLAIHYLESSPGNMKFTGVLPFTRLENSRRAMACDPEKCFLSMFKTLHL